MTINDVLVGEVWVASGQSNMRMTIGSTSHAEETLAGADLSNLRIFHVREKALENPADDVSGEWLVSSPEAMRNISAVAFLFAREILGTQDVPVGILLTVIGGTRAVNWTSNEVLRGNPDAVGHYAYYQKQVANYPGAYNEWKSSGGSGKKPSSPTRRLPGGYFNGMVNGLIPYSMRGAIWYQGETDSWNAEEYVRMFPDLIQDWRDRWGLGDFPFYYVQLAGFNGKAGVDVNYPHLRDVQLKTLDRLPGLGMAVAIDVGEEMDIHPRDKRPVAHRLALLARTRTYGESLIDTGPVPASVNFEGDRASINFGEAVGGLVVRNGPVRGFELAGTDALFHPATAVVQGTSVTVRAKKVSSPVYLRYGFHGYPKCNLYNSAGLPASPFRTDYFPRGHGAVTSIPE